VRDFESLGICSYRFVGRNPVSNLHISNRPHRTSTFSETCKTATRKLQVFGYRDRV
jgi:hypothetical protein